MKPVTTKIVEIFGDDVNTDVIFPARYLSTFDEKETASHLFEDTNPTLKDRVKNGGVLIGGRNFGCGSAREQAVMSLLYAGVTAIVARSFNRSFYRNAINCGLPVMKLGDIDAALEVNAGDEVTLDFAGGTLKNNSNGMLIRCQQPHPFIVELIEAGGFCNMYFSGKLK